MKYQPKKYFCNDRKVKPGNDLTEEQMIALRDGEVFILLDEDGHPASQLLMDSYNQIREGRLDVPNDLAVTFFGVPSNRKYIRRMK